MNVNKETILAVDTSTALLSMALFKKNVYYESPANKPDEFFDHSSNLVPYLDKLLKISNTKLSELTLLAVNIGPGSFTGLRIGLSFIKTLAIELKLKIVTTTSFFLAVKEFFNKKNFLIHKNLQITVLLPSVKNEFYIYNYAPTKKIHKNFADTKYLPVEKIIPLIDKKSIIVTTQNIPQLDSWNLNIVNYSARNIIELVVENFNNCYKIVSSEKLFPLYIRHTYYS